MNTKKKLGINQLVKTLSLKRTFENYAQRQIQDMIEDRPNFFRLANGFYTSLRVGGEGAQ